MSPISQPADRTHPTEGGWGVQRGKHGSASQKWLVVSLDVRWEVRGDLMGEPLLAADPLQQLCLERPHMLKLGSVEHIKGVFFDFHNGGAISRFGIFVKNILY